MAMLASKSQYVPQGHSGSHFQTGNMMLAHPSPTNSEFSESMEDIRSWNEHKVSEWLRSIGMGRYDSLFEENNITGDSLLECDQSVFKELGIARVGDRVRLFVAVKALRSKAFGNGRKRNRDTLAALDNVGSTPTYRTHISTQSQSQPTPLQNKRQSVFLQGDYGQLPSNTYSSPMEEHHRRNGSQTLSPPLETPRSAYSARTPRSQVSSPGNPQPRARGGIDDVMALNNVRYVSNLLRDNCIRVIGENGATKMLDISGCNTPEAVMRRILQKFSIQDNYLMWCIYSFNKDPLRENAVRPLGDGDLLRIVHDSNRPERERLILQRRGSPPTPSSAEFKAAQTIARGQLDTSRTEAAVENNSTKSKVAALTGHQPHEIRPSSPMSAGLSPVMSEHNGSENRNSGGSRKSGKKMQRFFGQRPPSELISSNLAEYFPDHEHKALERTVRNSMRRSARMSKYNNRLSVATTRSIGSNYSSDSIPPLPTVAGAWLRDGSPVGQPPSGNTLKGRPRSAVPSVLGSASYDYLGPVPENDVSPARPDRKSYVSFMSADSRDSVSVVVTDADSTISRDQMDNISMISTPSTEPEMQHTFMNSDEDEDDDDVDEEFTDMVWMKGTMIGSGSFGSVYLALHATTGELMAVKQVEMPTTAKEDARKQSMIDALTREIALLKDMQHPNIVQYLHSNKEDNCFNIFLEYVPGGSVAAMLNNYGPLSEPLIRSFVRQILQGLEYLHGKNIIHRDIKGANVLVDNKGCVKISDFGISKKVEAGLLNSANSAHRPSLQGSVFWMAPEVVKQTSYTLKADIWSLGCLIVEMFTGEHPYPDCSQLQAIFKIGTSGSAPTIPEKSTKEAQTFLGQTFELDYQKRPTAEELLRSPFLLPLVGHSSSD